MCIVTLLVLNVGLVETIQEPVYGGTLNQFISNFTNLIRILIGQVPFYLQILFEFPLPGKMKRQ